MNRYRPNVAVCPRSRVMLLFGFTTYWSWTIKREAHGIFALYPSLDIMCKVLSRDYSVLMDKKKKTTDNWATIRIAGWNTDLATGDTETTDPTTSRTPIATAVGEHQQRLGRSERETNYCQRFLEHRTDRQRRVVCVYGNIYNNVVVLVARNGRLAPKSIGVQSNTDRVFSFRKILRSVHRTIVYEVVHRKYISRRLWYVFSKILLLRQFYCISLQETNISGVGGGY